MKKSEKKELIKQISRLCEKQYRKGVQHGTEIHFGSPSQKKYLLNLGNMVLRLTIIATIDYLKEVLEVV
jgi:hypothetical protein